MSNQIYLLMLRSSDPDVNVVANLATGFPKEWIRGDSLDLPFAKFIRVTGVTHSNAFSESVSQTDYEYEDAGQDRRIKKTTLVKAGGAPDSYAAAAGRGTWGPTHSAIANPTNTIQDGIQDRTDRGGRKFSRQVQQTRATAQDPWGPETVTAEGEGYVKGSQYKRKRWGFSRLEGGKMNKFNANDFAVQVPPHKELSFSKHLDNATPQLAYACSAQESIRTAMFFFRRKIGVGVRGVRLPYLIVWLSKCRITGWSLDDDTEKVALTYRKISWITYDLSVDWNIPTSLSTRTWNAQKKEGGENMIINGVMLALMAGFLALGEAVDAGDSPSPSGGALSSAGQLSAIL